MAKILLKNATLISAEGTSSTANIALADSLISAVGDTPFDFQADQTIDCTNKLVTPGLINTHTHAAMTLLRSYADDMLLMDWLQNKIWPAEANLTGEDVTSGTLLAIAEMIKSGTTTFADMYFFMPEVAAAVAESGIRAVLSRGMTGITPTAEQALTESEAFFKDFHNTADGRITVMIAPHAPYTCPPPYLKRVVSLAARLGAEIHIHLSETKDEVTDCQKTYGKSPIALMDELGVFDLGTLAAHCVHVSAEDIAIMKEKKVRVAHNPGSNMKLASGIAPVPEMLAAGVCVGLGTDGASSNNNLDMLEELRLAATLHKVNTLDPLVIPAKTAFNMATTYGAKALGLEKSIGEIRPGFKADLVLWDMEAPHWYPRHDTLSLFTYAANAGDVHTVIVDGKILLDNKKLTTIDEERLLHEANRRSLQLVK